jgi:predicted DNA binding CopG/RHH family protein
MKKKGNFMKHTDISILDDYEMKEEYDFSDGIRGRFYEPKKIPTTLRLDNDIILYFKKLASIKKIPYQTLINSLLRKELQSVES